MTPLDKSFFRDYLKGVLDDVGFEFNGENLETLIFQHILSEFNGFEELLKTIWKMLPTNPLDDVKANLGGESEVAEVKSVYTCIVRNTINPFLI